MVKEGVPVLLDEALRRVDDGPCVVHHDEVPLAREEAPGAAALGAEDAQRARFVGAANDDALPPAGGGPANAVVCPVTEGAVVSGHERGVAGGGPARALRVEDGEQGWVVREGAGEEIAFA